MLSPQDLFKAIHESRWPPVLILEGNDTYLRREFRNALKSSGFDYQHKDLKKKGPQPHDEDLSFSTSLFSQASFVWLESQAKPDRWSAESKKIWERMIDRADGHSLIICLQLPAPVKATKNVSKSPIDSYRFETVPGDFPAWIKRMNKIHDANLSEEKLKFLQGFDADLITIDGWIELWSLGGDVWAEIALGWGEKKQGGPHSGYVSSNPAYAWVDSILSGDARLASFKLHELMSDSKDPLPLLGLISKTLEIWAALEQGVQPSGEAPFLIDKIKKALSRNAKVRGRGTQLLKVASELDVLLKSKPIDPQGALVKLSSISF